MNALVKLNNLNLRKLFKDCDDDADGLLTSAQLAQGLVEFGGMHPALAKDQALLAYLETFSKRKAGHFGCKLQHGRSVYDSRRLQMKS